MLRYRILASAFPLLVAGLLTGGHLTPTAQPCIPLDNVAIRIAFAPWQSQQHVSFTDDPKLATVRVQIVESIDLADFTVIDDPDTLSMTSCETTSQSRYVGITSSSSPSEPVIYLSSAPGDYRIFVQSKTFSPREAAALVVGAAPVHDKQRSASL